MQIEQESLLMSQVYILPGVLRLQTIATIGLARWETCAPILSSLVRSAEKDMKQADSAHSACRSLDVAYIYQLGFGLEHND